MWNLWQSSFVRSLILYSALLPAVVTMSMVVAAYYKTRRTVWSTGSNIRAPAARQQA